MYKFSVRNIIQPNVPETDLEVNLEVKENQDLEISESNQSEDEWEGIGNIFEVPDVPFDENKYNIKPINAMIIACVIKEAIDSLGILKKKNFTASANSDINPQPLVNRCKEVSLKNTVINPMASEPERHLKELMESKLENDRMYCQKLLKIWMKSILTEQNFYDIDKFTTSTQFLRDQEKNFVKIVDEKLKREEELTEEIFMEKLEYQKKTNKLSLEIGKLRDEIEDTKLDLDIKLKYVEDWEKSRQEMNAKSLRDEEDLLQSSMMESMRAKQDEDKVHQKVQHYFKEYFIDIAKRTENWAKKYEDDMDITTDNITLQEARLDVLGVKLKKLKERHKKRQEEIKTWLDYKAKMKEQEEMLLMKNKSATKIQAWWRGVMVRRKLGPYKQKSSKIKVKDGKK